MEDESQLTVAQYFLTVTKTCQNRSEKRQRQTKTKGRRCQRKKKILLVQRARDIQGYLEQKEQEKMKRKERPLQKKKKNDNLKNFDSSSTHTADFVDLMALEGRERQR